jgi:hypothetical protein
MYMHTHTYKICFAIVELFEETRGRRERKESDRK